MFIAFDHLSNYSPNQQQQQLFQTPKTTSLFAGLMEMQQQQERDGTRIMFEEVDEKKEIISSVCEGDHSESIIDAQSCDSMSGMKLQQLEEQPHRKLKGVEMKIKKHRYAFETRSHVDILDDGYRWRKYGQKAVKNNKFPRSYYRCTHQGCNVKKQVQRLSKDEAIVITTYEGIHSHPIQKCTDNFEHILTQMQIYNTSAASR